MLGANAFGWSFFGQIAEDQDVEILSDVYTDSRFAVAGFGWPYLGALPGAYLPTPPGPEPGGQSQGVGDAGLYQGGPLVPLMRPPQKKRKLPEFWPLLPKPGEIDQSTFTPPTAPEEIPSVVKTRTETEETITKIFIPGKEQEKEIVKPKVLPKAPAEKDTISTISKEFGHIIDKKALVRFAEEMSLIGLDSGSVKNKKDRVFMEEIMLLEEE